EIHLRLGVLVPDAGGCPRRRSFSEERGRSGRVVEQDEAVAVRVRAALDESSANGVSVLGPLLPAHAGPSGRGGIPVGAYGPHVEGVPTVLRCDCHDLASGHDWNEVLHAGDMRPYCSSPLTIAP